MRRFAVSIFVATTACGSVATVDTEPSVSAQDAGSTPPPAGDAGVPPTPDAAAPAPFPFDTKDCPVDAVVPTVEPDLQPQGAVYRGDGRSLVLYDRAGQAALQPYIFSGNGLTSAGPVTNLDVGRTAKKAIYPLSKTATHFAISDVLSDATNRLVTFFGPNDAALATVEERNTGYEDLYREGISDDGEIAYPDAINLQPVVRRVGSPDPVCVGCSLIGVVGGDLYVIHSGMLERRPFTRARPGNVAVIGTYWDDRSGVAPWIVGAVGQVLFLSTANSQWVVDRTSLAPVPYTLATSDRLEAVVPHGDGTIDAFSLESGEFAYASRRDASGAFLAKGQAYPAYGFANPTPCGFWVGNRHIPFAK
jgi:hypothetical protein